MNHISNTLLEQMPPIGERPDPFQAANPNVAGGNFSYTLRGWNLDPETIMVAAQAKTAQPDARTSDEILQSWGMQPLPSRDIKELVADEHVLTYHAVLTEAMAQLSSERPHAKERTLWAEARRIADIVFVGGEHPNELGFRTGPDIDIPLPNSIKDRTHGFVQRIGRTLTGTGPVATLQYYAGKAHAWFNDLPTKYKLVAGGAGITAAMFAVEVAALDAASEMGNQLEAELTAVLQPDQP